MRRSFGDSLETGYIDDDPEVPGLRGIFGLTTARWGAAESWYRGFPRVGMSQPGSPAASADRRG